MWLPLRLRRLDGQTLVESLRPTALGGGSCAIARIGSAMYRRPLSSFASAK
jgi:hypothetical protein